MFYAARDDYKNNINVQKNISHDIIMSTKSPELQCVCFGCTYSTVQQSKHTTDTLWYSNSYRTTHPVSSTQLHILTHTFRIPYAPSHLTNLSPSTTRLHASYSIFWYNLIINQSVSGLCHKQLRSKGQSFILLCWILYTYEDKKKNFPNKSDLLWKVQNQTQAINLII